MKFLADVVTLGIAEVASTPTEAATRNKKTPVWFCYRNGLLARVTPKRLEAEDLASSERAVSTAPASAESPANSPQGTPAALPALKGTAPASPAPAAAPSNVTE